MEFQLSPLVGQDFPMLPLARDRQSQTHDSPHQIPLSVTGFLRFVTLARPSIGFVSKELLAGRGDTSVLGAARLQLGQLAQGSVALGTLLSLLITSTRSWGQGSTDAPVRTFDSPRYPFSEFACRRVVGFPGALDQCNKVRHSRAHCRARSQSETVCGGNGRRRYRCAAPVGERRSAPSGSMPTISSRWSRSPSPMQSTRLSGAAASAPNTSRSVQPATIASAAHRSRNAPAASTILCQRSGEKPWGAGIEDSAAKPSAHRRGILAPYSTMAARSSRSSIEGAGALCSDARSAVDAALGTGRKSCPTAVERV